MNQTSYSIAEARNKFTHLIREAEISYEPVQVTRRGDPVVVVLSIAEYERLKAKDKPNNFWHNYLAWREKHMHLFEEDDDEQLDQLFNEARYRGPAPEIITWD